MGNSKNRQVYVCKKKLLHKKYIIKKHIKYLRNIIYKIDNIVNIPKKIKIIEPKIVPTISQLLIEPIPHIDIIEPVVSPFICNESQDNTINNYTRKSFFEFNNCQSNCNMYGDDISMLNTETMNEFLTKYENEMCCSQYIYACCYSRYVSYMEENVWSYTN
jgi:hypothetical protein